MAGKTFVVIGAGVGGLATALRLAHRGEKVLVLEKTDVVGGRNRPVQVNGCSFDGGPTLMMMLDPFYTLFEDVGEHLDDHLEITLCDPSYRVFFADGKRLDGTPNVARMVRQIQALAGPKDAAAYPRFLGDLGALYHSAVPNFVRKNFYSPIDFFGVKQLGLVQRHHMLSNLARRVDKYFEDPRLRMLFSFQTMYLGLSPFQAPWVYAVLTYMEYGEGIWYPKGGIVAITEAIAKLAQSKGAEVRLNAEVDRVEGKTVLLKSGERIEADTVICNADLPFAERDLLGSNPKNRRNSCSAYMMYVDYGGDLPDLLHHNVFFGKDFRGNLEEIFERKGLPSDPAFYAAVSAKTDHEKASKGHQNLYLLVPCANLQRPWSHADACALKEAAFSRLEKETSFDRDLIRGMKTFSPEDWANTLNLHEGAAFGLSHDFLQSAYFRPANRSRSNPDVYFVGASTTPGNGLPMVLISAELLEQRLQRDGRL